MGRTSMTERSFRPSASSGGSQATGNAFPEAGCGSDRAGLSPLSRGITEVLWKANRGYLAILPALATFSVLYRHGQAYPALEFLGGIVVVGTFLAVAAMASPRPRSLMVALFDLLDGPAWALAALVSISGSPIDLAIQAFSIDAAATIVAVLLLAQFSSLPSRNERLASTVFMLIALGAVVVFFWPYYRAELPGNGVLSLLLCGGIVQGVATRTLLLSGKQGRSVRNDGFGMILLGVLLWLAAFLVGGALHPTGM